MMGLAAPVTLYSARSSPSQPEKLNSADRAVPGTAGRPGHACRRPAWRIQVVQYYPNLHSPHLAGRWRAQHPPPGGCIAGHAAAF